MSPLRLLLPALAAAALGACMPGSVGQIGQTCVDDAECPFGSVCVLGICVDPKAQSLDEVDLEVHPTESSGFRSQQIFGVRVGPKLEAGEERATIRLSPTVNARGNVVDAEGNPVRARVVAIPQSGIPGRALVVSADAQGPNGEFNLPLVAESEYRFAVYPSEQHARPPHYFMGAIRVRPSSPEVAIGTVELPEPASLVRISGRVVTRDGAAALGVAGLEVRVLDGTRLVSTVTQTNGDGAFSVVLAPGEGAGATLEIRPTESSRLNPARRIEGLDLENPNLGEIDLGPLPAPVPFSGVVTGPDGDPVPQAKIYAKGAFGDGEIAVQLVADEQGRYDGELRPGRYHFAVVPPPEARARLLEGLVADVAAGTQPALSLREGRMRVAGEVVDAAGERVPTATVRFSRIGASGGGAVPPLEGVVWTFTSVTDDDGRFSARLDPGRYRVTVLPDEASNLPRHTEVLDVDGARDDLRFRLYPAAYIAARLLGPSGSPVKMALVTAFAPFVGEQGEALELGSTLSSEEGELGIVLPDLDRQ